MRNTEESKNWRECKWINDEPIYKGSYKDGLWWFVIPAVLIWSFHNWHSSLKSSVQLVNSAESKYLNGQSVKDANAKHFIKSILLSPLGRYSNEYE